MKKTLHSNHHVFASSLNGEVRAWSIDDADVLIEAANMHLSNTRFNPRLSISLEELFNSICFDLMARFQSQGQTEEFLNEVNSAISHIRYQHILMPSEVGQPHWQCVAQMNGPDPGVTHPDPGLLAYFIFSNILAMGGLKNLRRCNVNDCQKFFIGPKNKKSCSTTCGSKYRVRKKRKRDRERAYS